MKNENIDTNENLEATVSDEVVEELSEGFDEFAEITDGEAEEIPAKKSHFFANLSKQAVCKLFFLFAGIGFFFPFFTISCMNAQTGALQDSGYPAINGLDLIIGKKIPFLDLFYGSAITADNNLESLVTSNMLVLIAFTVICLGLILTVVFKDGLRNIFGLICSGASAIILGIFAFTLKGLLSSTILSYLQAPAMVKFLSQYGVDPTKDETIKMFNLDSMVPKLGAGFWFVLSLMVVNFIYFIVMIAKISKQKAREAAEFAEIIAEYDDVETDADMSDEYEIPENDTESFSEGTSDDKE